MSLSRLLDAFSAFIDLVAVTLAARLSGWRRGRPARIEEAEDGAFRLLGAKAGEGMAFRLGAEPSDPAPGSALKGRDVELVLDPGRFIFQPLELPKAASGFLSGIVRAQIDRLTPWSASEAAYGWTEPVARGDDRISLEVAAAPSARITPLVEQLKGLGARTVSVATQADGATVRVLAGAADGPGHAARIRQILLAVLGASALGATLAVAAGDFVGAGLDAEREALDARLVLQRRVLSAARDGTGAEGAALRALERLKREQAATVLVLEALSDVLPDGTYLTQIEIEDGKVGLTGVSREASALIAILERSQLFSQATFAAPTTRSDADDGERFQIEARITLPAEAAP